MKRRTLPSHPALAQAHIVFAPPDNLTEAEINQRREVVLLIQQLCVMGKKCSITRTNGALSYPR